MWQNTDTNLPIFFQFTLTNCGTAYMNYNTEHFRNKYKSVFSQVILKCMLLRTVKYDDDEK